MPPPFSTDCCRFVYRPKPRKVVLAVLFFGAITAFSASTASHNVDRLNVNGLITLSPPEATGFFWLLAILSGGMTLAAIGAAVANRVSGVREIAFSDVGVSIPRWAWSLRPTVVPYDSIWGVGRRQIKGHQYLRISYASSRLNVMADWFESAIEYFDFQDELARRMQQSPTRRAA